MHRVPQAGPWWPAVDAPVERGVRHPCALPARREILHTNDSASPAAPRQEQSRYTASAARADGFAWRSAPCIGTHCFARALLDAFSRRGRLTFWGPQFLASLRGHFPGDLRPASLSSIISTSFDSDQSIAATIRFEKVDGAPSWFATCDPI
jgi:hypothetical protein